MPRSAKCSFNLKVSRNSLFWVFISKITCHQRPMFLGKKCRTLDAHASKSQKQQQNIGWKIPLIAGHKHLTSPPLEIQSLTPNLTKAMIFQLHRLLFLELLLFFCCSFSAENRKQTFDQRIKTFKNISWLLTKKNWYNYTHP